MSSRHRLEIAGRRDSVKTGNVPRILMRPPIRKGSSPRQREAKRGKIRVPRWIYMRWFRHARGTRIRGKWIGVEAYVYLPTCIPIYTRPYTGSQPTTSGWRSLPKDIWLPPASMPSHTRSIKPPHNRTLPSMRTRSHMTRAYVRSTYVLCASWPCDLYRVVLRICVYAYAPAIIECSCSSRSRRAI